MEKVNSKASEITQGFTSVKIEVTNTDQEITLPLKPGDILIGQRETYNGILKDSVWVRYSEDKYDWYVFYIGDNCLLIN